MHKYNIYIGMFDKNTKQQEISTQDYLNKIRQVLRSNKIDNYTIYKAKGHYTSDTMIVCEPSIIVEIIISYELFTDDIKHMLCKELNQESVLITKQSIEVL